MQKFSYLKSTNADYIDELFARYSQDPSSVDDSWRYFFEGLELGVDSGPETGHGNGHANGATPAVGSQAATTTSNSVTNAAGIDFGGEAKVAELIQLYRAHGNLIADIDPLQAAPASHPLLDLANIGLGQADLSRTFQAGKLIGIGAAKLSDILAVLKETYCGTIAVEYTQIKDPVARQWLQTQMESTRNRPGLDPATKQFILKRVTESESFERFLHTRYVAAKRFSIEGSESLIPSLDAIIEVSAELGAHDYVIAMPHRGRLNVLTHILGKATGQIFTEFEGTYKLDLAHGEGDVKYHKGGSLDFTTRKGKKVHLSMAANPSHLEFVGAVAEGMVKAKQDRAGTRGSFGAEDQVIPIILHGDAAFAGQGIVYEVLNMSQLEGYKTGGSIHIVVNNQVGFTTSPKDARSTVYATDLAKMLDSSPIFHVNGDDPEAVWHVSRLCAEYRQKFKADVFIDLMSYRKHGHNEGDEPSFTQPLLYKKIKAHASTREVYAQKLAQTGVIAAEGGQQLVDETNARYIEIQTRVKATPEQPVTSAFDGEWKGLREPSPEDMFKPVKTAVDAKTIQNLSETVNHVPASFHLHPKLNRFFEARLKAVQEGKGIDWGNGEALAYATLVNEGHIVRLTGQDAERGTFTHRHSVLTDVETGEPYTPFNHLTQSGADGGQKGRFFVYNSHLSETGVLGYEYGYSLAAPRALTLWEAQFGDFANGAQVIIDQFLAAGESKWLRMSGLVLLLPHGYEGQGAEHSSARLERFLDLCGRDNLIIANLTTPAQIFHALRRQVKRDFRKPLVIMSPKSLLRHPQAVSTLHDLTQGGFQEVIGDATLPNGKGVKRVLLCSGKIYYELMTERATRKRESDVAIVRVEQLYPWAGAQLALILKQYSGAKEIVWVQEEPRNMGAWPYVFNIWNGGLGQFSSQVDGRTIHYAGRIIAAAPAVGSPKVHEAQQKALLEQAFSAL